MKILSVVLTVVSIILIAGAILGVVATVGKIGETFDKIDFEEDSKNNGSSNGGSSNGGSSGATTPDVDDSLNYFINESTNTGYVVSGDTTYFFKVIEGVYEVNEGTLKEEYCGYLEMFSSETMRPHPSYAFTPKLSYDLKTWKSFSESAFPVQSGVEILGYIEEGEVAYLCYASIVGCNTPQLYLEDLNQNVFFNENYFDYALEYAAG